MTSASAKIATLFAKNWKIATIPRAEDDFQGFATFITDKKLNFLNHFLFSASDKGTHLQQEFRLKKEYFMTSSDHKTRIASELLNEERRWKAIQEEAEGKKIAATSKYLYQFLALNSKISQAQKGIHALQISNSGEEAIHSALEAIEVQQTELKDAELQLRNATGMADALKEKPKHLSALVRDFQQARNEHRDASTSLNMAKSQLEKYNKDMIKIKEIINFVSNSNQTGVLPQIVTPRFWMNVAMAFSISARYRGL